MNANSITPTFALASFYDMYSPRIVTRRNDHDVKIVPHPGEHVRHAHTDANEFFVVLDGRFDIALRQQTAGHELWISHANV